MTAATSKQAYHEGAQDGTHATQYDKVLNAMRGGTWLTRRQVAEKTGIELGAIAGRVNHLIHQAGLIEESEDRIRCPLSGKSVKPIRIKPEQRVLFNG